jgi:hypothetical protein
VSSNNVDGGASGGDGGGDPFWTRFITIRDTSFSVRWLELFSAVVAGTVVVFFQTVVGAIQSGAAALETLIQAVTHGVLSLLESVFGVSVILDEAFAASAAELASTGIFAFVLGVAIAGLVAVIYSWGVSQLVE